MIGTLNPVPQRPTNLSDEEAARARAYKEISLDRSRAKYWLGVGAQPSDSVWRLLNLVCFAFWAVIGLLVLEEGELFYGVDWGIVYGVDRWDKC